MGKKLKLAKSKTISYLKLPFDFFENNSFVSCLIVVITKTYFFEKGLHKLNDVI